MQGQQGSRENKGILSLSWQWQHMSIAKFMMDVEPLVWTIHWRNLFAVRSWETWSKVDLRWWREPRFVLLIVDLCLIITNTETKTGVLLIKTFKTTY